MVIDRRAFRRQFLGMVARRQRPGAGSDLAALDRGSFVMEWWAAVEQTLHGIPHAVVGAVAANAYAPPRATTDIDFAVTGADALQAEAALHAAGWHRTGSLGLVLGSSWRNEVGHELDLIVLQAPWSSVAIREAQRNRVAELPTLPLPYLVLMKMAASRAIDLADVSRMLGRADAEQVATTRGIVQEFGDQQDLEDFEQLVHMGRLERGAD
ncbi:MAG: hypothetical protein ACYDCQ_01580 [Dehalococcoidia bacterium]